MENNPKPPTQSVGVAGFKADLYASDVQQDDVQEVVIGWHILIHLPKFQMYAVQMAVTSLLRGTTVQTKSLKSNLIGGIWKITQNHLHNP